LSVKLFQFRHERECGVHSKFTFMETFNKREQKVERKTISIVRPDEKTEKYPKKSILYIFQDIIFLL